MNKRSALALIVAATLVACSNANDASIQLVKSQASEANGLTIGQVLDAKSNCASKGWTASQDKYQRAVVTFECNVTLPKDRIDKAVQSAKGEIDRRLKMVASFCHADPSSFIASKQEVVGTYYARFDAVKETLEYVVNQGQVVEVHVGLEDANGGQFQLSQGAIYVLPKLMQRTDDGAQETDALIEIIMKGAPSTLLACEQMLPPSQPTNAGTPEPANASSGVTFSDGDRESQPEESK